MSQGLQAGSAFSIYRLDLRGFDQDVARIKRELDALYRQSQRPLPAPRLPSPSGGGGGGGGSQPGDDSARLQRQADASLRLAQARARLAQIEGDEAGALKILNSALGENANASQRAQLAVQTQTARIRASTTTIERNAGAFRQFSDAAKSGLLGIVGPAAAATAALGTITAAVSRAKEGFELRATLDEQRRSVQILIGDVERGGRIFDEAAAFGRKYGFTQREMGQSAEEAADLIRKSTVATQTQLEVLARLASRNSRQGFSGAVFSAKELQSGDITSIVERFNVARSSARAMKEEIAAGADVFLVLDKYLNSVGATTDVLNNRTLGAAGAARTYAQSQEDLTLAMGQFAEGPGLKALDILTKLTNGLTSSLSIGDQTAQAAQQAFAGAASFQQYGERVTFVNQQLGGLAGQFGLVSPLFASMVQPIQGLSEAQFNYAQSLMQQGVGADVAIAKAQGLADVLRDLSTIQDTAAVNNGAAAAALQELTGKILQAASAGPEAADGVLNMASAVSTGELSVENFRGALNGLIAHQQAVTTATSPAIAAFDAERQAIGAAQLAAEQQAQAIIEQTQQTIKSGIETEKLAQFQATLARLGGAVAGGHLTAAQAAGQLGAQYSWAKDKAYELIIAQSQLAGLQAASAITAADGVAQHTKRLEAQGEYYKAIRDAQEAQTAATGTAADKQALLNRQLDRARITYGEQSAEFINAQTKLIQFQQSQDKAARGGSKGSGGAKLTDQDKLNNKLLANEDQYQAKAEDAERKHVDNLLKIERDYAARSLEQQRANEVSKRQSRYSFYQSLSSAGKVLGAEEAQSYSAAYEQAFAESQQLAQAGQHKLAAERLSLRQRQIQDDIEAAKAIAEARKNEDADEIARLEQLEALRKDAQREELKGLEGRGDDLVGDRQKAIDEERQRFADANEQNALSAGRKADAVVTGAEREKKAIGDVNELLAKQNALYGNRGATPGAAPAAVATPPIGGEAAASPAVAPSAGDAARLMAVADAALLSAVEAQTQMQVGKFDTLIGAVQSVERRVGAVESAVKSIPRNVN